MRARRSLACLLLAAAVLAVPGFAAADVPDRWLHGANLTTYDSEGLASDSAADAIAALGATGADAAAVVVPWYQPNAHSSMLRLDPVRTPSDRSIGVAVARARERGMRVLLKPQIEVEDGSFRGAIDPLDRAEWFARYGAMIDRYARVAEATGADALAVGVELAGVSSDPSFRAVIGAARAQFGGDLTYAANWDEVAQVPFWGELDEIGVDGYFPLSSEPGASVNDLVEAWQPALAMLADLSRTTGKRVLFTELGYARRLHAAVEPWAPAGPIDEGGQARAYEAALSALSQQSWVAGVFWWDWPVDPSSAASEFSPRGAAAESVLRRWNGRPAEDSISRNGIGLLTPLGLAALAMLLTLVLAVSLGRAAALADRDHDERVRLMRESDARRDAARTLPASQVPPPAAAPALDGAEALRQTLELALRVRRALPRWPLRKLDVDERAALAEALHEARSFDDLAPGWRELILQAEAGPPATAPVEPPRRPA